MSRRFWILAAMCAALTMGTLSPEQAQAGWRRRCCGRVYGCRWGGGCGWRGGYGWRGGWGGWYGGYRGYGVCSTGYGLGGNYLAGFGSPYGTPYVSSWSMPNYANSWNVNPYLAGAYSAIPVTSTPGIYTAGMFASQPVTARPYPGDPVEISRPTLGFAARMTALVNNSKTNTEPAKVGTSFLARHGSGFGTAIKSSEGINGGVARGYGYGSGYSYKSAVENAPRDLANFGLNNVAMNR